MPVEYLILHAQRLKTPLALFSVNMEKAFDMVPCQCLVHVLLNHYSINSDMLETIRRMYTNTLGQVAGRTKLFTTMMGVHQRCPMSPLLFALFFDCVVQFIKDNTASTDAVMVMCLEI